MLSKVNGYTPTSNNYNSKTKSQSNPAFNSIHSIARTELEQLSEKEINFFNEKIVNLLKNHKMKVISGYSNDYKTFYIACEDGSDKYISNPLNVINGSKYNVNKVPIDIFNSTDSHIEALRQYNPHIFADQPLKQQDKNFIIEAIHGFVTDFAKK